MTEPVDIAIITAKHEEYHAVTSILDPCHRWSGTRENPRRYAWKLHEIRQSGTDNAYKVVLALVHDQSNVPAALATVETIREFSPRYVIFVGIAGSLQSWISQGDVVVADYVWGYEYARLQETGKLLPRHLYTERLDNILRTNAATVTTDYPNWYEAAGPKLNDSTAYPQVIIGSGGIASGDKVLETIDAPLVRAILKVDPDLRAVDMESHGVAQAVRQAAELHLTGLMVVRGISDVPLGVVLDHDATAPEGSQQASRQAWTEYASLAAATFVKTFISTTFPYDATRVASGETLVSAPSASVWRHHNELLNYVVAMIHPSRGSLEFTLTLAYAPKFDELEREEYLEYDSSMQSLLDASNWRKLLIHAPGGHGKTNIICRLINLAISRNDPTFLLDATRGLKADSNHDLTEAEISLDSLFSLLSPAGSVAQFNAALQSSNNVLLVFDGLNEVSASTGDTIIRLLDRFGTDHSNLRLIITDRMNPRYGIHTMRATILPITEKEVSAVLASAAINDTSVVAIRQLLTIPFFLDLQLRLNANGATSPILSRSQMIERYFVQFGEVREEDWSELMRVSFRWYETFGSRTAGIRWVNDEFPTDLHRRLFDNGVCRMISLVHGDTVVFRHQLLHDYLVGRYICSFLEEQWTSEVFDVATLRTQSFEPISFAVELLGAAANRFLILVYDWNYWAVNQCINDLNRSLERSPVSPDLVFAMDAKNAEKRFEVFTEAVSSSVRRLEARGTEDSKRFLQAHTIEETIAIARKYQPVTDGFDEWKIMFTVDYGGITTDKMLLAVAGEPIIGWTAANAFRRCGLNERQLAQLRIIYRYVRAEHQNLRWRIAHILGAYPLEENIELLEDAITLDTSDWVRYGAFRSLMEIAVRGTVQQRSGIFQYVREHIGVIASPLLLQALRRTAVVNEPPQGWYSEMEILLEITPLGEEEKNDTRWLNTIEEVKRKAESERCL